MVRRYRFKCYMFAIVVATKRRLNMFDVDDVNTTAAAVLAPSTSNMLTPSIEKCYEHRRKHYSVSILFYTIQ